MLCYFYQINIGRIILRVLYGSPSNRQWPVVEVVENAYKTKGPSVLTYIDPFMHLLRHEKEKKSYKCNCGSINFS